MMPRIRLLLVRVLMVCHVAVTSASWMDFLPGPGSGTTKPPHEDPATSDDGAFSGGSVYSQWIDFVSSALDGTASSSPRSSSHTCREQVSDTSVWSIWNAWYRWSISGEGGDDADCTWREQQISSPSSYSTTELDEWVESFASTSVSVQQCILFMNRWGFPSQWQPSAKGLVYLGLAWFLLCLTLLLLYRIHRRRHLKMQLQRAHAELEYLREKVLREDNSSNSHQKEVRIFMDGAFDLIHFGHMNAFRLGKSLGTHLVVGLNSDESITKCKGAPLMNDEERYTMVSACKFVNEVVRDVPYIMNREYIDYIIEEYNIDYVVHGDDPCIVDGKDVYATAKERGKYRSIPRTEGVSTTDIVGRMLLMTKEHHFQNDVPLGQQSKFLTTSRMLRLFSQGVCAPPADARVIYIDGAWDLFHPGHVSILKAARERGDYLVVGILNDAVVNRVSGVNLPLMNLHERVLSVLGCRYTDDVLIDAPLAINEDMIDSLHISEVVQVVDGDVQTDESRFRVAKDRGILHRMNQPCDFSLLSIVQRIQHNQETFQARFERKMKAEETFYNGKRRTNGGRNSSTKRR